MVPPQSDIVKVEVLVVGGGQAGVAASEHLTRGNINHLVVEKSRIAESWRTARWDSLVANGPAWHDRFPGLEFPDAKGDDFIKKDNVAAYLEMYAKKFHAPIWTGVTVLSLTRLDGKPGFRATTSQGSIIEATFVVVATGAYQTPVMPKIVQGLSSEEIVQIHSAQYKNPRQLPKGNVLVVGSGSSGAQIAEELALTSNKRVFLSMGPHDRPPRSYRGRDFVWWLGVLNMWDAEATEGVEHTTIAVSGARGGHTIDFREMAKHGVTLLGRTQSYDDGKLRFAADLERNILRGDANYLDMLNQADEYVTRNGLDLPEEPSARHFLPFPSCVEKPILELSLAEAGITSIIWATGFQNDYSWLNLDAVDSNGRPQHQRGVSKEPGVYFLGLPWQTRRGSSFIWGVWHDAQYVVSHIAKQRGYHLYKPTGTSMTDETKLTDDDSNANKSNATHLTMSPVIATQPELVSTKTAAASV